MRPRSWVWVVVVLLCGTGGCRTVHSTGALPTHALDPQTGRTWASPSAEAMEWSKAKSWCERLGSEWRLPYKDELVAFAARGGLPRPPHQADLPPVQQLFSGEIVAGRDPDQPWVVALANGHAFNGHGREAHVQCVRALGRIEEMALTSAAERRWAAGAEQLNPALLTVDDAYVMGPGNAPVTLVFFFDYQCPYCNRANATLQQLVEQDVRVRVVYKAAAILEYHDHAVDAHLVAYAAGRQGQFWPAKDRLFEVNRRLSTEYEVVLAELVHDLGLDPGRFAADLADPTLRARVMRETGLARAVQVTGLPTTFVNGHRISGSRSLEDFQAAVDDALR